MAKTRNNKYKKHVILQKTRSSGRSSDNGNRKKRNLKVDFSPAIKIDNESDDINEDDSVLSTVSKRLWSILGYYTDRKEK